MKLKPIPYAKPFAPVAGRPDAMPALPAATSGLNPKPPKPARVDVPDPAPLANADGVRRYGGPLFRGEPRAKDVRQGAVGSCWLLATIAAIAEAHPKRIKDMIRDNGDGTYTVRLYEMTNRGYEPREIVVDADLPVRRNSRLYAGSPRPLLGRMELWVALLEKAVAQQAGGYANIDGSNATFAFDRLLGVQDDSGWTRKRSADEVWKKLVDAQSAGGLAVLSTRASLASTDFVPGHAYAVLKVEQRGDQRWIKLYNPHGETSWHRFEDAYAAMGAYNIAYPPAK